MRKRPSRDLNTAVNILRPNLIWKQKGKDHFFHIGEKMTDTEAKVAELKEVHQQRINELKKNQLSEYNNVKKTWQEEAEKKKIANVQAVADFRQKAAQEIQQLVDAQLKETENHENQVMPKFEESLKEVHVKELKQKLKERKIQDKQDLYKVFLFFLSLTNNKNLHHRL